MMVIFDPSLDAADTKKRDILIGKLLGEQAKFIKDKITLGKKQLAYDINKQKEGLYCLFKLDGPRIDMTILEKQVKLMPEVIRYLLVQV